MKKFKQWWDQAGLSSFASIIWAICAFVFLKGNFQWFVAGCFIGIFIYVNGRLLIEEINKWLDS